MGNRAFSFKRLSEESSPPEKVGFSDSHSKSIEMEPLQEINGNNKWHKTYTRLGTQTKRWTFRRFKPWCVTVTCFLIISIAITVTAGYVGFKFADHSFASKQDVLELRLLLINESLDRLNQQLNNQCDQKGYNNSYPPHLHDQISAINQRLNSIQPINVTLSGHIDAIQRNLSDLSKLARILQTHIDALPRKDSVLELDVDSTHNDVTSLTQKVNELHGLAANLSSAQLDLENGMNQFRTNVTSLVAHVQNDVSSIRDSQDHIISVKIASLQHSISLLGSQLDDIRHQASSTTQGDTSRISNRLNQLENQFNALSSQIHNPVNLYKNCWEDNASCSIDPDHSHTDYWRDCPTEYLPLHKPGWFTISYQCKYKSASRMNMETLTPFEWEGKIRCDCDVTFPGNDTEHHRPVPRDIKATCTLVVIRCPLSLTIY